MLICYNLGFSLDISYHWKVTTSLHKKHSLVGFLLTYTKGILGRKIVKMCNPFMRILKYKTYYVIYAIVVFLCFPVQKRVVDSCWCQVKRITI